MLKAIDVSRDSRARKEWQLGILEVKIYCNATIDRYVYIWMDLSVSSPSAVLAKQRHQLSPTLKFLPSTSLIIFLYRSSYINRIKNLYARALPNMPKEYLTRLVFDANHKSLALVKDKKVFDVALVFHVVNSEQVVGAICFRPFVGQDFLEIVFCAIASDQQVKVRMALLLGKAIMSIRAMVRLS